MTASGGSSLVGDRARFVAYERDDLFVVADDKRNRAQAMERPANCAAPARLAGLRFPWLLVTCDNGLRIVDVATGTSRAPAGFPEPPGQPAPPSGGFCVDDARIYGPIGGRWLAVTCRGAKGPQPWLVDWRTGATTFPPASLADTDLDTPRPRRIARPDCRVRKPTAAQQSSRWVLSERAATLRLRPCAGGRLVTIGRCTTVCRSVRLEPTVVTWRDGNDLHAYLLSSGRHLRWAIAASTTAIVTTTRAVWIGDDAGVQRGSLPKR